MKKTIAIALIALASVTALFAGDKKPLQDTSSIVKVNAAVAKTDYNAKLYYGEESEAIGDTKELNEFSILTNDQTGKFSIKITGNENKSRNMSVVVTPEFFKTTVDNKDVTTTIKPVVNGLAVNGAYVIKAGLHKGDTLASFNLSWTGDADLAAGDYVSNVGISYTIE